MGRIKMVVTNRRPRRIKGEYLLTLCAENGGWVRYQDIPACMGQGHRVNFVHSQVYINEKTTLKVWQGLFYCVQCKLMGTTNTMKDYSCS